MRRLVGRLLEILSFDPRSRRAIDETLLDWAAETERESSAIRRVFAHALGLVGVLRAVVGCSFGEIGRLPFGWVLPRILLLGVPMMLISQTPLFYQLGGLGPLRLADMMAWALPRAAVVVAAPLLCLAVGWRSHDRHMPAVGTALLTGLVMTVLVVGILPITNALFSARYFQAYADMHGHPLRGTLSGTTADIRLAGWMLVSGDAALAVAAALLGAALSRSNRLHSWLWIPVIPAAYTVVIFGSSLALLSLHLGLENYMYLNGARMWALAALAFGGVMRVQHRDVSTADLKQSR
jgi:hypothetical protein